MFFEEADALVLTFGIFRLTGSVCYEIILAEVTCFLYFRFDSELQKVSDAFQAEKMHHERIQREKDEIAVQKYSLEQELKVTFI